MTTFATDHTCDICGKTEYGDTFLPTGWVMTSGKDIPTIVLCETCAKEPA